MNGPTFFLRRLSGSCRKQLKMSLQHQMAENWLALISKCSPTPAALSRASFVNASIYRAGDTKVYNVTLHSFSTTPPSTPMPPPLPFPISLPLLRFCSPFPFIPHLLLRVSPLLSVSLWFFAIRLPLCLRCRLLFGWFSPRGREGFH